MKPSLTVVAANENVISVKPTKRSRWSAIRPHLARAAKTAASLSGDVVLNTLRVLRYALFYVLMWLRILVHFASTSCASISLLVLVLAAIFKPDWSMHGYMWKLAGFSFACFLVGWLYDGLLLVLSPEPMLIDGRPTK